VKTITDTGKGYFAHPERDEELIRSFAGGERCACRSEACWAKVAGPRSGIAPFTHCRGTKNGDDGLCSRCREVKS